MKVQVRFNEEELTLAITRHLEAEGYTVKDVRFSYDQGGYSLRASQLDAGMGASCEADVERGPGYAHPALTPSHIAGARTFTPDTDDLK